MTHKITLKNGFKLNLDDEIIQDYDFIDAYRKLKNVNGEYSDDEQMDGYMQIIDMVFGNQKNQLFKKIREENGKLGTIPFEYADDAIAKLNALVNGKN